MDRRVGKHHRSTVFILQSVEQNVRFFFPPSTHEKWSCCKTNCTGFSATGLTHRRGGSAKACHTHTLPILAHSLQVGGDSGDAVRHKSSRWPRPRNLQVHRSSVPLQRNTWKHVSPARLSLGSNRVKIITDMEICIIALGFRCDKYSQCNAHSHEEMPLYWDFVIQLF